MAGCHRRSADEWEKESLTPKFPPKSITASRPPLIVSLFRRIPLVKEATQSRLQNEPDPRTTAVLSPIGFPQFGQSLALANFLK